MSTLQQPSNADSKSAVDCDSGGGGRRRGDAVSGGSEEQFVDAVEIVGVPENSNSENKERRESGVLECTVEIVDLENEGQLHLGKVQRDCRICHLSMDAANQDSGFPIELGCSCKEDLAAAHKQCAEAWFKIKGDK